jgi:hypothetical protein
MNEQPRTLMAKIRTGLIVTLITIMVWLLAESRMVRTRTLEPPLVLTTAPSIGGVSLVVRQSGEDQIRTVAIEIEGSTSGLDRFSRVLQNKLELRVGVEIPAKPGRHTLDLLTVIRQSSDFAVNGLTVTEVTPKSIVVEVDELLTQDFPIRVITPADLELDGAPTVNPASIQVQAPSQVLRQVSANEATVLLSSSMVAQLTPGRLENIPGVVVELPGIERGDWSTVINPAQVDVSVIIKTLTETITIDRMPVQVLIAPLEIGGWKVEIEESDKDLVNIEIAGPASSIDQIRSGELVPTALITLTFEDLGRGIRAKPAQILGLPSGCRVVSALPSINLQISRVEAPISTPENNGAQNPD